MTTVKLNFKQRWELIQLLGQQEGPLARTLPFLTVLKLIRLTAEEQKDVFIPIPGQPGQMQVVCPSVEYGSVSVDVESADVKALRELIDTWPKFRTIDHDWIDGVVEQLEKSK